MSDEKTQHKGTLATWTALTTHEISLQSKYFSHLNRTLQTADIKDMDIFLSARFYLFYVFPKFVLFLYVQYRLLFCLHTGNHHKVVGGKTKGRKIDVDPIFPVI